MNDWAAFPFSNGLSSMMAYLIFDSIGAGDKAGEGGGGGKGERGKPFISKRRVQKVWGFPQLLSIGIVSGMI